MLQMAAVICVGNQNIKTRKTMEKLTFPVIELTEVVLAKKYTNNKIVNQLIEYGKAHAIEPFSEVCIMGRFIGYVSPLCPEDVCETDLEGHYFEIADGTYAIHYDNTILLLTVA